MSPYETGQQTNHEPQVSPETVIEESTNDCLLNESHKSMPYILFIVCILCPDWCFLFSPRGALCWHLPF